MLSIAWMASLTAGSLHRDLKPASEAAVGHSLCSPVKPKPKHIYRRHTLSNDDFHALEATGSRPVA